MIFGSKCLGAVRVFLSERYGDGVLGDLAQREIPLWDIRKEEGEVSFFVGVGDLGNVRKICLERGCHIRLGHRYGLLFWWKGIKDRKAVAILVLGVVFALWGVLSVAWDREIVVENGGHLSVEERQTLLDAADRCGLAPPLRKEAVDPEKVSAALRKECPFLSWVSVSPEGMSLVIRVAEKKEDVAAEGDHGHIIAEKDGTILKILVLKGQKQVEPNSEVKKGDILISGDLVYTEEGKDPVYDKTAAKGSVIALVRYEGTAYVPLEETTPVPTGKTAGIVTFGKEGNVVTLWGYDRDPFRHSITSERSLTFWGWELRLKTYREVTRKKTKISPDEALRAAEKEAGQKAEKQIPDDAVIVSRETEDLSDGENSVGMRVILECEEEIDLFIPVP